jgi:N-acetylmuramoyl-L-alanine amidase
MKFLFAALVALALAPAASAGVSIIGRDVSLQPSGRALAATTPRFNMVGLHWQGSGVPSFRVRGVADRWSRWYVADDDWGRDGAWRKGQLEWTGAATAIQYRTHGRVTKLRAYFVNSTVEDVPLRRLSIANSPPIIPRSGWQADESIRRAAPHYATSLSFALVHHTVNSNNYTPAQSAAIVRGIEVYHVKGNGWDDIGYNFLVDKYGQVFEGRYGGVERNVIGAHSQGFNTGSVGVAVIGTFDKTGIPAAAESALEQLLSWRLDIAHIDPLSTLTVPSRGNSRFPSGIPVFLRAISGHRDTYFTDCPGDSLYAQIPAIAKDVAALGLPKLYSPLASGKIGGPIRFTGQLSGPIAWTVSVNDSTGKTVASGGGTSSTIDWTWDATTAPPGSYSWTIGAGPTLRPARGTIGGKLPPLAITDLAANPPVTDGTSVVSYTLSTGATVTGTLTDSAGTTIAPLFSEPKPTGKQTFTFNALPTVPDGQYALKLQAQSADGQQATASTPIQLDRAIASFGVTPPVISPNGDGRNDAATISLTLTHAATATLALTKDGTQVAPIVTGAYDASTPITTIWGGEAIADGTYDVTLTIGSITRAVPLLIDTKPPALRAVSWPRLRFKDNEPGTVTLIADGRRYTKKLKVPGAVAFSTRIRGKKLSVAAHDVAGNITTLRRR